jgi:hypothetical protein
MVRPIGKQGERKNVYLSKETIDIINEMSKVEGLNFSQFIDMAVTQIRETENPQILLEKIQQNIIIKEKEMNELKQKEIEIREIIKGIDKWKNNLNKKRTEAITIITRKLLNNEIVEAERIAKTWSRIIHCSYIDLINEASVQLGGGI